MTPKKPSKASTIPAVAARQKQLPTFARMPKPGPSHAGLFRQVPNATPIAIRGAPLNQMGLDDDEGTESKQTWTTVGFRTRMDITLPEAVKAQFGIVKASVFAEGAHSLGANELRVYLAVLGLAASGAADGSAMIVTPTTPGERSQYRRQALEVSPNRSVHPALLANVPGLAGAILHPHIVVIKKSLNAIAVAAGLSPGAKGRKAVVAGLRALEAVTMKMVLVTEDDRGRKTVSEQTNLSLRLLTASLVTSEDLAEDEVPVPEDKRIRNVAEICLDPVVTDIVRHVDDGVRYDLIALDEVRALSDIAVLLHGRLCAKIPEGRALEFGIEKLVTYVYDIPEKPDEGSGDAYKNWQALVRKYKHRVRTALAEIHEKLKWEIVGIGAGSANKSTSSKYRIARPKAGSAMPSLSFYACAQLAASLRDIEISGDADSLFPDGMEQDDDGAEDAL